MLVELSGIMDSDFLSKCENKCKILVSLLELGDCSFASVDSKNECSSNRHMACTLQRGHYSGVLAGSPEGNVFHLAWVS